MPERVWFTFNDARLPGRDGESIAAALLAANVRAVRRSVRLGEPRGLYCGIGLCFDCVVTVDGQPNVRACLTQVADGMRVESAGPRPPGDGWEAAT
jgi:sarcosine oxidase, subunit alpha